MTRPASSGMHFSAPGLLPWEYAVAAFALGILSLKYPVAGVTALATLLFLRGGARTKPLSGIALCVVCAAGLGYAWLRMPIIPNEYPQWMLERRTATVSGTVVETQGRIDERCRVFLEDATFTLKDGRAGTLPGVFLWDWQKPPERPLVGQKVTVRLRVRPARGFVNPDLWNTQNYWAQRGAIYRGYTTGNRGSPELTGKGTLGARIRADLLQKIKQHTQPGAGRGLLAALTMGDRFWLPRDVYEASQAASLAHSLALSGLHLGFAAAPGFGLAWLVGWFWPTCFLRLPRLKLGTLLSVPLVLGSVWLGGATPSLVRAAVMFAAWGVLLMLGRPRVLLDGVFLAVGCILAVSPLSAFDIRLQFSAVAVAGIGLLMPEVWRLVPSVSLPHPWRVPWHLIRSTLGIILVSACANIALFPLSIWNFGQVGTSLYLNALWLPVLGFVVIPAGLAGVVLSVFPGGEWLGGLFFELNGALLEGAASILRVLSGAGSLPVMVLTRPTWQYVFAFYLLGVLLFLARRVPLRRLYPAFILAIVLIAWPMTMNSHGNGDVRLRALDVGQSQAILVELPSGTRIMVDGGGSWNKAFDIGRAVVTPTLTYNHWPSLDYAIMSHPDTDHFRGLVHPLKYLDVGLFAYNGRWPDGDEGTELKDILSTRGIARRTLSAGDRVELEQGYAFEVLAPEGPYSHKGSNDSSLVLRLVRGDDGLVLFPGDIEEDGLAALLATSSDLSADVLVLPHHGSKTSLSDELYRRVSPKLAIACAGFINYLRFPNTSIRQACRTHGFPIYVTGERGQVRVTWKDGRNEPAVQAGRL